MERPSSSRFASIRGTFRPSRIQGWFPTTRGWNIAPFKFGSRVAEARSTGGAVWTEHRPIQTGAELRFPPFAHRAFGCLGGRRRGRSVENAPAGVRCSRFGMRTAAPTFGVEHRPIQESRSSVADVWRIGRPVWRNIASHCRSAETTGGAVWTEHRPIQNRGRVAFPTLRPPRLRLFGGPAPWTKRGKRTTAVTLVEVGSTPDRERGETVRCQATSKTDPGRHENRPPSINGTALTGLSTLCPRRRSPVNRVAVVKGWITPSTTSADRRFRLFATPPVPRHRPIQLARGLEHRPIQSSGRALSKCEVPAARLGEHRPIQTGAGLRFPPFAHRAFGCLGDRRRGRSVENARPLSLWSGWGRQPDRVPGDTRQWLSPGDTKADPLSINGTALTGYPRFVHGDDPQSIESRWSKGG